MHAVGGLQEWIPTTRGPYSRDLRLNTHLGAGGAITQGRIQDPEGAKIIVISFKSATRSIAVTHRQTLKFVCFADTDSGRLVTNTTAIVGGKQNLALKGRRVILIYKTLLHQESSLEPEPCTTRTNAMSRLNWILAHIKQIDKYENIYNPEMKLKLLQHPLRTRSAWHALGAVLRARLCEGTVSPSPL